VFRFLTLCGLCVLQAAAQWPDGSKGVLLRGQIVSDQTPLDAYVVELRPLSGQSAKQQTLANSGGDFLFQSVEVGEYSAIISDRQGLTVYQTMVHVDRSSGSLEIRLPSDQNPKPGSGVVTIASLQHRTPKAALREYRNAMAAKSKGDPEATTSHLRASIRIDPDFAEAHNDLAVQLVAARDYPQALDEIDKAASLDPNSAIVQLNRAVCLAKMGRFADAESPARKAVENDKGAARARFMLGAILAIEGKSSEEAIENLIAASNEFPEARLTAAHVLVRTGRIAEARKQLSRFLTQCPATECDIARKLLQQLSTESRPAGHPADPPSDR